MNDRNENVFRKNIVYGEKNIIKPGLPPGNYKWKVRHGETEVADFYSFSILTMEKTGEILNEMKKIDTNAAGTNTNLLKAYYLQLISDSTAGLDLYGSSLSLLLETGDLKGGDKQFKEYLLERIAEHPDG